MKTFNSRFFPALAASSLLAAATSAAIAASPKLKGTYAETGEAICLVSTTVRGPDTPTPPGPGPVTPSGFNPQTLAPNVAGVVTAFTSILSSSFHGVRTFDGQGSGTREGRTVGISSSPTQAPNNFVPGANASDLVGTFTYDVAPDGTITTTSLPSNSLATAGPRTGQTFTNSGFSLVGRASVNNRSLTLTTDVPQIETVAFSNGDVQERICHRSRTLIWMGR
jgi:hypothetical protein